MKITDRSKMILKIDACDLVNLQVIGMWADIDFYGYLTMHDIAHEIDQIRSDISLQLENGIEEENLNLPNAFKNLPSNPIIFVEAYIAKDKKENTYLEFIRIDEPILLNYVLNSGYST